MKPPPPHRVWPSSTHDSVLGPRVTHSRLEALVILARYSLVRAVSPKRSSSMRKPALLAFELPLDVLAIRHRTPPHLVTRDLAPLHLLVLQQLQRRDRLVERLTELLRAADVAGVPLSRSGTERQLRAPIGAPTRRRARSVPGEGLVGRATPPIAPPPRPAPLTDQVGRCRCRVRATSIRRSASASVSRAGGASSALTGKRPSSSRGRRRSVRSRSWSVCRHLQEHHDSE